MFRRSTVNRMGKTLRTATGMATWLLAMALFAAVATAPAGAAARSSCAGMTPTLVGSPGRDRLVSHGRDVIWAGPGDDAIRGAGGNDTICGGPGEDTIHGGNGIDRVYGGPGEDRIFGQQGTDHLWGGDGGDTVLGQRGSDRVAGDGDRDALLGGAGNDRVDGDGGDRDMLLGGSGDDRLHGGSGNYDHVYGGLGADLVDGGPGSFDLIRGDDGHDTMDGGGGSHDVASFATANPPGAAAFQLEGVYVDLQRGIAYGHGFGLGSTHGIDRLRRIEDAIGSPFDDRIVGNGNSSRIEGGFGRDAIGGVARGPHRVYRAAAGEPPSPQVTHVGFGASLDEYSALHVLGGAGPDRIDVSFRGASVVIVNPAGLTVDGAGSLPPGTGCSLNTAGTVATCASRGGIDTLALNGGAGDDVVDVDASAPRTFAAYLGGGDGADAIEGGPGDDFIQGGTSGQDTLDGSSGDDSLQSDSGGDLLRGGPGDDLMVVSLPCNGGATAGGPGGDRVGFNPAPGAVSAAVGGPFEAAGDCRQGSVGGDVENLEGSKFDDTLIGDSASNSLIGRKGNDTLIGAGSEDELEGGPGEDTCDGGPSRDSGPSCESRRGIP